jgi:hypothetical protein
VVGCFVPVLCSPHPTACCCILEPAFPLFCPHQASDKWLCYPVSYPTYITTPDAIHAHDIHQLLHRVTMCPCFSLWTHALVGHTLDALLIPA